MIYDCFIFFNELELLELRLHELAGVVDKFVLVEATRTFSNKPKPLHFQDNRDRFAAFGDRIIHVVVADSPDTDDAWVIERFQRNAIAHGLTQCQPDDWILLSDVDEIPRASAVKKVAGEAPFKDGPIAAFVHAALNAQPMRDLSRRKGFRRLWRRHRPFVWKFHQTVYQYYLNLRSSGEWYGTRMARYRDVSWPDEMRYSGRAIVRDGGWHFSSMGGVDRIIEKVAAYSHQENNVPEFQNPAHIESAIAAGHTQFDKTDRLVTVPVDGTYPQYLRENPGRFEGWIRPLSPGAA